MAINTKVSMRKNLFKSFFKHFFLQKYLRSECLRTNLFVFLNAVLKFNGSISRPSLEKIDCIELITNGCSCNYFGISGSSMANASNDVILPVIIVTSSMRSRTKNKNGRLTTTLRSTAGALVL